MAFNHLYVVLPFPASPPAIGVPLCSNVCVVRLRLCSASAGAQSTTTCALLREGSTQRLPLFFTFSLFLFFLKFIVVLSPSPLVDLRVIAW